MANAEFVDHWNNIIPHKIKVSELVQPTESFVYRCVLSFFRMMKYDMQEFENMYNEPKESTIQKRVDLVAHVNHFYQLCLGSDKSTFFYVDLIKPSPKKTVHVLNILLNYLFYVNMVRDDTIERATGCTARFNELSARKNQKQREIENQKIKQRNIERNIHKMSLQVPQLERKNDQLRKERTQQQQKMARIRAADEECAEAIAKCKMDLASLKDKRVEDDEAAALIQKNEAIEAQIVECERQESALQQANSEYSTLISQIRPCVLVVEQILQNPLDNSLKTIKNEVDTLKLNCHKLKVENANKKTVLTALKKNCAAIQEYINKKSKELKASQRQQKKTERLTRNNSGTKQAELDELQQQNEASTSQIQAVKEELLLILQIADDTMRLLAREPVTEGK